MVGHGHIDPVWLWRWTEGFEEVRATFRSALDRMDESPAFFFTASSSCFYAWVERSDPELFEAVKRRVEEGRWELAGGFYVEPDCNIPCGESFVRQGLYGQRYFQSRFGKRARVGFNPDGFGHAGTLPQILKKLGLEYYAFERPEPRVEREYPEGTTFYWESADGSRVLTSHIPLSYNATDVPAKIAALDRYPNFNANQPHVLALYGVGNHGGGPTKKAIADIGELQGRADAPTLEFSTLERYFNALLGDVPQEAIPTVHGELQYHARGCYSAEANLKRLHRSVEHALLLAERFATAAWLLAGQDTGEFTEAIAGIYPQEALDFGWQDLLFNQFHDILCGTSIPSAYDDARDQLGAARHRADVVTNDAMQNIARPINTSAAGNTIVVVNPLTWPVDLPIVVGPVAARNLEGPIHFVDENEREIPSQVIRHERPGDERYTFTAALPATGYRLFHARSGAAPVKLRNRLDADRTALENDWWRIEFDPYEGFMTRLYDRTHHVEILKHGAVLACLADGSDTWSHGVDGYAAEVGRFGQARLHVVEFGDVQATLRVASAWNQSTAIQEFTIYRDISEIDILLRVNWQESYTALKLSFETNIEEGRVTAEAPYGHRVSQQDGNEEVCGQWVDLTGTLGGFPYGLALLNDGAHGYDVRRGTLRQTILRSPAYAHHLPGRVDASKGLPIMDQGWHTIRLRLAPHAGPWQDARIVKRAWELNVPMLAHHESAHPGKRGGRAQLLGTEADNVLVSVLKQSEEGHDLIIRAYEIAGKPALTKLHLPFLDKSFELALEPHEIKTLRINPTTWAVREVNLLEE
jgi:alpha-mannosidase